MISNIAEIQMFSLIILYNIVYLTKWRITKSTIHRNGLSNFRMAMPMKAPLMGKLSMDMGSIDMLMEMSLRASGKTINSKAMEF